MRVLYFSPRDCWPVTTGARLRDFHLARQLACAGKLTYLGFAQAGTTETVMRQMLTPLHCSETILVRRERAYSPWNLVRGLAGPAPISVLNYTSPRMDAELTRILKTETFDAVQIEGVHLFSYVKTIRAARREIKIICDWHNIESELMARYGEQARNPAQRLYAARTAALLRQRERDLLRLCDAHTVCSRRERDALLDVEPRAQIEVIGNGVDVDFYSQDNAEESSEPRRSVVFVGSMDYHANIEAALYFAAEIWPLARARRPELQFMIVGSRPAPQVRALEQQPGITVTGTVDDVRPFYRGALAVVAPLRVGSGTRLKILEAMAAGAPVVSTSLGAEGLAVTPGRDVWIADDPEAMAARIADLDESSKEWRSVAAHALQLVRDRYDWAILGKTLRRLYSELYSEQAAGDPA